MKALLNFAALLHLFSILYAHLLVLPSPSYHQKLSCNTVLNPHIQDLQLRSGDVESHGKTAVYCFMYSL